jgi:hypothetical protein
LVGIDGITVLNNGNYVVKSTRWNGQKGAVTWRSGTAGGGATVGAGNSLVGSTNGDAVGSGGVQKVGPTHYLVISPNWNSLQGAATWGNGTSGTSGVVSASNSLLG